MILTYSSLKSFSRCKRLYYYKYILFLRKIREKLAINIGSAMHELLCGFYSRGGVISNILEDTVLYKYLSGDEKSQQLVLSMINSYKEKFLSDFKDYDYLALEKPFITKFWNPYTGEDTKDWFCGVIDGCLGNRLMKKCYHLMEHKTAGSLSLGYLEQVSVDYQIALYSIFSRAIFGVNIESIIYNVIEKKSYRLRKKETIEEYRARLDAAYKEEDLITRLEVVLTDDILENAMANFWAIYVDLCRTIEDGSWYGNSEECFRYGKCDFFDICRRQNNDIVMENEFDSPVLFPELVEAGLPVSEIVKPFKEWIKENKC